MSGSIARLPDPRERPWLSVAELAEITGEGEKAIRAALDAGQLPLLRVGRYCRIPTAALLAQLGIAPEHADELQTQEPQSARKAPPTSDALAQIHVLAPAKTGDHSHGAPPAS